MSADHLTVLGLLAGLAFCPLLFVHSGLALAALSLHVVLDGLDGPLARHQGVASRAGSLTDTFCDQLVVAATSATLVLHGSLAATPAIAYVFVYTVVVVLAMARNAAGIPYRFVIRPRLLVYLAIPIDVHVLDGTLDVLVTVLVVPLAWFALRGFLRLRARI